MADVTDLEEVYSKLIRISRTSSSFLRETNVLISYLFQFGRSQSYRVATTPLVDDGGKGKDGGKPAKAKKLSKSKAKKKEKKENLEDLKKELEIVSREFYC